MECRLSTGAWYSIGATTAYFLASVLMCAIPRTPSMVETAWCCKSSREVVQPKRSAATATRTEEDSTAYQGSSAQRTRSRSLDDVEMAGHHQQHSNHRPYHHQQQQRSRQDAIREEEEDELDESDSAYHDDDDSEDSSDDY